MEVNEEQAPQCTHANEKVDPNQMNYWLLLSDQAPMGPVSTLGPFSIDGYFTFLTSSGHSVYIIVHLPANSYA